MIGFFPDPYPDELLYSICARYRYRAGYRGQTATTRDLFGDRAEVGIALPGSLSNLISALPPGHRYSVDQLIDEHTLLSFYAPFMPPSRVNKLRGCMAEEKGGRFIHGLAGMSLQGNIKLEYLQFCPACGAEDRLQYGETYFHRAHQAPGVFVCPRHAVWLEPSALYIQDRDRRRCFLTAEQLITDVPARLLSMEEVEHQIHLWIAREAQWLLDHSSGGNSPEELRARYQSRLFVRGLANYAGVVRMRKLQKEICNFYSEELLTELHCRLDLRGNWLTQLLLLRKNTTAAHHPMHHLLTMRFLDCSVAEFFQLPTRPQPFGTGPWPCLNPVCKHYQEPCIQALKIRPFRTGPKGKEVGKTADFRCVCGFTYSRRVPDPITGGNNDRYWVKSRGSVWDEALRQLSLSGKYTSREVGQKLGVTGSLIRSKVVQIRRDWEASRKSRAQARAEARRSASELKRATYREQMGQAVKDHPAACRSQIRSIVPVVYEWLLRHDREWTEAVLPPPRPHFKPLSRPDWDQRDRELAAAARAMAERLRQAPGRPIRVSKFMISKRIGALSVITARAHHLPLTRAVLEEVSESLDDGAIRRIQWAAECFRQANQRPTSGQVLKLAVVQRKTTRKNLILDAALDAVMRTFETPESKPTIPD